ncbi:Liprinalpha1like, partial [Caligus rogercresseyi]
MEDSSHSTPSPMSSAASSQDSLNRGPYFAAAASASHSTLPLPHTAGGGKKGVKSTLGRFFGKKEKQIKSLKMVTPGLVGNSSQQLHRKRGIQYPPLGERGGKQSGGAADLSVSEGSIPLLGLPSSLSTKGDFDRRKKK